MTSGLGLGLGLVTSGLGLGLGLVTSGLVNIPAQKCHAKSCCGRLRTADKTVPFHTKASIYDRRPRSAIGRRAWRPVPSGPVPGNGCHRRR